MSPGHRTPHQALDLLKAGNQRFVTGNLGHPNHGVMRRVELVGGQGPFAVVIGCSDSRVPPEVIFDCGLGDLFVVRTAGNLVDALALGSVEFAVEHLGVSLALVLGHAKCGAVTAAVESVRAGSTLPGSLSALVDGLRPAVEATRSSDDPVAAAIGANVELLTERLARAEPILAKRVRAGELVVTGGVYSLETGAVSFIV